MKTSAAIIQIFYGSYELYAAAVRSDQFQRLGYAAYSLTVIPYVLMSFLNGLTSLSRPSYPSMYLVYYCGHVNSEDQRNMLDGTPSAALFQNTDIDTVGRANSEAAAENQGMPPYGPRLDRRTGPNINITEKQDTKHNSRVDIVEDSDKGIEALTAEQIKQIKKANETVHGAIAYAYGIPQKRIPKVRKHSVPRIHKCLCL